MINQLIENIKNLSPFERFIFIFLVFALLFTIFSALLSIIRYYSYVNFVKNKRALSHYMTLRSIIILTSVRPTSEFRNGIMSAIEDSLSRSFNKDHLYTFLRGSTKDILSFTNDDDVISCIKEKEYNQIESVVNKIPKKYAGDPTYRNFYPIVVYIPKEFIR